MNHDEAMRMYPPHPGEYLDPPDNGHCDDCGEPLDEGGICQDCTPGDYVPPDDVTVKDGLL